MVYGFALRLRIGGLWGLGFRVSAVRFKVYGFRVQDLGFRFECSGFRV